MLLEEKFKFKQKNGFYLQPTAETFSRIQSNKDGSSIVRQWEDSSERWES